MVSFNQIFLTLALSSLILAAAPEVEDSPKGAKYVATFDGKNAKGSVEFSTSADGAVEVHVDLKDLPSAGGPFLYHIHQKPVPTDGNCTGTAAHLNPYNGSETNSLAADKEVGDLSGKHGTINGTSIDATYIDKYISLNKDDPAYFGNLSVVVHLHNTTRIACANITEVKSSNDTSVSTASDSGASAGITSASGILIGAALAGLSLLI